MKMNKKMRELLAAIEVKTKAARGFQEAKDTEKALETMTEIEVLQGEYSLEEKLFKAEQIKVPDESTEKSSEITKEEKAFLNYISGVSKELSAGSNGAVIPKSIANKIIEEVKELSPIYARCTIYNVKGVLSIPVYGLDEADDVQAAYGTEFTDLTAHAGKFTSVDLTSLSIGALTKISNNLINNTDVDVLGFIVKRVGKAIADFLTKELIAGSGATGHMTGIIKTTNVINAGSISAVNAENMIDIQLKVPELYQAAAMWIMNKDAFKAIRKLKDGNGEFLMTRDFAAGFGWNLLGKPVSVDENMPAIGSATVPIAYGDFSGMACKLARNVELKILNELYAAQNATGVVAWVEADSKIENAQKFVGLKMSI